MNRFPNLLFDMICSSTEDAYMIRCNNGWQGLFAAIILIVLLIDSLLLLLIVLLILIVLLPISLLIIITLPGKKFLPGQSVGFVFTI